jgi:hypothetical protein
MLAALGAAVYLLSLNSNAFPVFVAFFIQFMMNIHEEADARTTHAPQEKRPAPRSSIQYLYPGQRSDLMKEKIEAQRLRRARMKS